MTEFLKINGFRPQLKKSLEKAYTLTIEKPGLSFSSCMGNSFRQTISGIFSHPNMNSELMLSGHVCQTLERVNNSKEEYIIAAQDTTYYNYSGHKKTEGLGVIRDNIKGLIQHNVFLTTDKGVPLGVLDQQYWTRKGGKDYEGKESLKWYRGLEAVNRHLGGSNKKIVVVQDREADIFEFFKAERADNVFLLVRVHEPRNMEVVSGGQVSKLTDIENYLSDFGQKKVHIERNKQEVELTLSLKAGKVNVYPRKELSPSKHKTQGLSLVIAEEVACIDTKTQADVFNPNEKAIWFLLTSLEVSQQVEVENVVSFYAARWMIERFHYTLKSGALNVEKLQFDNVNTLIHALCFYSVVAWKLLAIIYTAKQEPDTPAEQVFDKTEIAILEGLAKKKY